MQDLREGRVLTGCPERVGGALGGGRSGRRRTLLGSATGSGLGFPVRVSEPVRRRSSSSRWPPPPPLSAPPRRRLGDGRDFRFRAGGQAGGAGLPGRGRGRHFRSGPRVSPERRRLLRLLGLLPAETPAPVSDGARGPGARGQRGRGVPPWPALVPTTSPSVSLPPGPRRGSPITARS